MESNYEKGFEEYIDGGVSEENSKNYRCSVDLYYKALCQLLDFLLFRDGINVKNLKERMEKINILNSEIYYIFKISHSIYRSAYKFRRDKKDCNEIKNGIKKIIILKNVEGRFKEIAEKI